jgi:hypothetical protein
VSASGRASDITIITPTNFYLFGMANGSDGTYTAKLLGSNYNNKTISLKVTHESFNLFSVPLNFWMKAAA